MSWYRNAKDASRPASYKAWKRGAQALLFAAVVFGPAMAVASAGTARGAKTVGTVAAARNVAHASAWVSVSAAAFASCFGSRERRERE